MEKSISIYYGVHLEGRLSNQIKRKGAFFWYGKISYVTLIMETRRYYRSKTSGKLKETTIFTKNLLFLPLPM